MDLAEVTPFDRSSLKGWGVDIFSEFSDPLRAHYSLPAPMLAVRNAKANCGHKILTPVRYSERKIQ